MNDNSVFPFGEFAGRKLRDVPARKLLTVFRSGTTNLGLHRYIALNYGRIVKRAQAERQAKQ